MSQHPFLNLSVHQDNMTYVNHWILLTGLMIDDSVFEILRAGVADMETSRKRGYSIFDATSLDRFPKGLISRAPEFAAMTPGNVELTIVVTRAPAIVREPVTIFQEVLGFSIVYAETVAAAFEMIHEHEAAHYLR